MTASNAASNLATTITRPVRNVFTGMFDLDWRGGEGFVVLATLAVPVCFGAWMALLNNFAVELVAFNGKDIGFLQSVREIPGFLAFTVVFVLAFVREIRLLLLSLACLGLGVALTGMFPSMPGLYITTIIMSVGFHYFEALQMSLTLQFTSKERAPVFMGQQIAFRALASLLTYGLIWLMLSRGGFPYWLVYGICGAIGIGFAVALWWGYPSLELGVRQHQSLVLRPQYWLFYVLTFLSGARRQIFVVFAGFLMVERFGMPVNQVVMLYLVNHVISMMLGPWIGRLVARWGERTSLVVEYAGLTVIFICYALADNVWLVAVLYILDHLFFAMAIALKSYFRKIADERDIAATAAVGFTINHGAAVFLPAVMGLLWLVNPALVFYLGAALALLSLLFSLLIPSAPHAQGVCLMPWRRWQKV